MNMREREREREPCILVDSQPTDWRACERTPTQSEREGRRRREREKQRQTSQLIRENDSANGTSNEASHICVHKYSQIHKYTLSTHTHTPSE